VSDLASANRGLPSSARPASLPKDDYQWALVHGCVTGGAARDAHPLQHFQRKLALEREYAAVCHEPHSVLDILVWDIDGLHVVLSICAAVHSFRWIDHNTKARLHSRSNRLLGCKVEFCSLHWMLVLLDKWTIFCLFNDTKPRNVVREHWFMRTQFFGEHVLHLLGLEHTIIHEQLPMPEHNSEDELFVLHDDYWGYIPFRIVSLKIALAVEFTDGHNYEHGNRNGLRHCISSIHGRLQLVAHQTFNLPWHLTRRRTTSQSSVSQMEDQHKFVKTWKNDSNQG